MKTVKNSIGRNIAGAIILLAIFAISDNCSKSSTPQGTPGTDEVFIQNNAFDPANITVAAGTTITWTNKDNIAHTVTSNTAGLFDSGSIEPNGTYPHTFATAGSFPYHCTVHPSMTATVTVN